VGSLGAIVFYDVTDRDSFNNLGASIEFLIAQVHGIKVYLVGNKTDLTHLKVIETPEIGDFSRQKQLNFMEVSCLNGRNVERSFNQFMAQIVTDILFKEGKLI